MVDTQARDFIRKYKLLGLEDKVDTIAIIPGMPDSYLTKSQEQRIRELMRIKTDTLWDSAFYDLGTTRRLRSADREGRRLFDPVGYQALSKD